MIETRSLVKWYGPTLAVDHVSFNIEPGQIVGFLGPNGAGKTTTLRILTGILPPTAGQAFINGHDVLTASEQARRDIGYLPESTPLYREMRVSEYLHYRGKLFGMDRAKRKQRINEVCDRCGLGTAQRRVIGHLSKGNRQRVGLAQALLHEPSVLILDEPTAGLDPNQIGEVRKLIGELRGEHTILLSSHILPEVEKTADRVRIITQGRIAADGTPEELRRNVRTAGRVYVETKGDPNAVRQALQQIEAVGEVETEQRNGWCHATVTPNGNKVDPREPIGQALLEKGFAVREMRHDSASLESYFVQITDAGASAAPPPPQEPEPAKEPAGA